MIEIKKYNSTKSIYCWYILINKHTLKESPCFNTKKSAKKWLCDNSIFVSELEQSITYKPNSSFNVPTETTMILNKYYNQKKRSL
jgi:hypothetical protein|tara:strand:- start:317 stop:571 length:255 start_codon:yes stop_codon:yes gene_type:complete